jgi:PAS domain S-box-containing protein
LLAGVEEVLITGELASRPFRAPDYEAESRALGLLAHEMATNPRGVLQRCAELVMDLCHADSAGISVLEPGGTSGMFRWHAAAGALAPHLNGTMPREASPCGTVMERDCLLLFTQAERAFPALRDVEPGIHENLLIPWHVKGEAVGTLWAIKHTPEGRFDAEDARVLQSLARSASAAFQMISAIDAATVRQVELEQRTDALVELEERQSFLLALSDAVRPLAGPADIQGETSRLLREKLNVGWCYYVDWDLDRKIGLVLRDSAREGLPSLAGAHDVSDAPEFLLLLGAGSVLTVRDYTNYQQLPTRIRQNFTALGFRSMMVAPLVKEGRLIASLLVGDIETRDWSLHDKSLLVEVAERTWAAIERARAETALAESEARLAHDLDATQVLQNISNQLISKPGVDGHFNEFCEAARALMRSDCASIQVLDETSSRLRLAGHVGFHPESAAFWEWVDAGVGSTCGRALAANERVIVADMDSFEAEPSDLDAYRRSGILSVQSSPLVSSTGQVVGMMSTHWHRQDATGKASYRFFDILARLAADFIVRIRAETALRESEAHLATELKHTELLRELALQVVAEKSFSTIYSDILSTAVAITGADAGTVQVYEPETKSLVLLVTQGIASRMSEHFHRVDASSTTACGIALRTGERSFLDFDDDETDEACILHVEAGLRSAQATPLLSRNGSPIGMINTHWRASGHRPSQDQLRFLDLLARQAADLIEQRRDAEALLESEQRFQQFAKASAAGLWIRDAETLDMEYVSPAIATIYGVAPDIFLGDMKVWAGTILPEDRELALHHLQEARKGEAVVHEFRIQRPDDATFRWIRNTDFPLFDAKGEVQRIGGIAEDVTDTKLAVEHQAVLLAELQHRVRNIMAILRSIAARTAVSAGSVQEYAELIAGRLNTFARVQALLTRAANAGVGIAAIVDDELRAMAAHNEQFSTEGPDVQLSPKAAETMTLAVHELTTNALKYGALSVPDGKVTVRWEIVYKQDRQWLSFDWSEAGAPEPPASDKPRRVGFGSELIEGRIPYELSGRGNVRIEAGGAQCHLEFPLKGGASILETGAPQRATVFGGAIDMTGQPDLTGQRILVVEDDYYLASDTARALIGAGAEVLGPCATEESAHAEMGEAIPTAAVLDINLGVGASFGLAGDLKRDGVPFVFITGYDQEVIPERFGDVTRLQKPVEFRHVIEAIAETLGIAP